MTAFNLPVKTAVVGLTGRMGKCLATALAQNNQTFKLIGGSSRDKDKHNMAVGKYYNLPALNSSATFTNDIKSLLEEAEVIIDYSNYQMTAGYLPLLQNNLSAPKVLMIGTSGITDEITAILKDLAKKHIIFASSNVSLVMALFRKVCNYLAGYLENFDVEIIENHHRHKLDSPSGGALALGEAIATARNVKLEDVAAMNRTTEYRARKKGEIGFSSIRGGETISEHEVRFIDDDESLTIIHTAHSRSLYANMTLKIVNHLLTMPPGILYDGEHLIDFFAQKAAKNS